MVRDNAYYGGASLDAPLGHTLPEIPTVLRRAAARVEDSASVLMGGGDDSSDDDDSTCRFEDDLDAVPVMDYPTPLTTSPSGASKSDQEHEKQLWLLKQMKTESLYWTGTEQQFDVEYESLSQNVKFQLNNQQTLGYGKNGEVHKVLCGGICMARKGVRASSQHPMDAIKSEVEAVQKLEGHRHIVKLVGSYVARYHGEDTLYILTFPVAECDLHRFLNSLEALNGNASTRKKSNADLHLDELLTAAGWQPSKNDEDILRLGTFLKKSMGCIAGGVNWVHSKKISHDDLKPANILLRRGDIIITDFGISRDRCNADGTSTEYFPGSTQGYCAPEKGEERHNPFSTDIYSLGCIYMHMISVITTKRTRDQCVEALCSRRDRRQYQIQDHLRVFIPGLLDRFKSKSPKSDWPYAGLATLILNMLVNDRHRRPDIQQVCQLLLEVDADMEVFHGGCCLPTWEDNAQVGITSQVSVGRGTAGLEKAPSPTLQKQLSVSPALASSTSGTAFTTAIPASFGGNNYIGKNRLWNCCHCGDSGMSFDICVTCGHRRCDYCLVYKN